MKRCVVVFFAVILPFLFLSACGKPGKTRHEGAGSGSDSGNGVETDLTDERGNPGSGGSETPELPDGTEPLEPIDAAQVTLILLNCEREPLNDVRIRRALSLALDRASMASSREGALALYAPIPDVIGFSLQDKRLSYREAQGDRLTDSEDFARMLLSQTGYSGSDHFAQMTMIIPEGSVDMQDVVLSWAEKLQIFINISTLDGGQYEKAVGSGDYDLALASYPCAPDATEYLARFAGGSAWVNREYDRLIESLLGVGEDTLDKLNFFEIAEGILTDEMPAIPLYYIKK